MESILLVLSGVAMAVASVLLLGRFTGFQAQRPADYAGTVPQFDLRKELNGKLQCEGVIYGPMGRVSSRFVADMEARWEGNTGVMTEHFRYDSGTVQNRRWTLTLGNDGSIRAEAADVIGTSSGRQEGSAVQLQYRLRLPDSAGGHILDVTDWMYLVEHGKVVNRSQFRKYGIKVAELVATMRKKEN